MPKTAARALLTDFLKTRRARLDPRRFGFTESRRRRSPGLRRSEVAQLAGISTAWYTLFEMGQERAMTLSIIEPVGNALQLTEDERNYIYDLVRSEPPPVPPADLPLSMMATFGLVQDFSVVAYDRWHTPIVWNLVTEAMFNVGRERERLHTNALWRMFFRPELRELLGEWEQIASRLIGLFRGALGRDPENADALEILAVMRASPDFERMWSAHEVSSFDSDTRENGDRIFHFRHPKHGMIAYHRLAIAIPSFAGGYLRFMTPSDDESRRHLATAVAHHIAEKGGRRLYDFAGLFNTVQLEDVRSALAHRHSARHRDDLTGLRDPFRE